jgi:hypothetical protein
MHGIEVKISWVSEVISMHGILYKVSEMSFYSKQINHWMELQEWTVQTKQSSNSSATVHVQRGDAV